MEPVERNNTCSLGTKTQQVSLKAQNFHSLEPLELKITCYFGSQNWRLLTGSNNHPNTGTDTQWSVRRICIKSDDKIP